MIVVADNELLLQLVSGHLHMFLQSSGNGTVPVFFLEDEVAARIMQSTDPGKCTRTCTNYREK